MQCCQHGQLSISVFQDKLKPGASTAYNGLCRHTTVLCDWKQMIVCLRHTFESVDVVHYDE